VKNSEPTARPVSPPHVDLSIVIVNWNVKDLLRGCLESLFVDMSALDHPWATPPGRNYGLWLYEHGPGRWTVEVIVVDSASSDGSIEMVRTAFPRVRLLAAQTNVGYTGGNNAGIQVSRGRYVLVLNPDTEVSKGALGTMLSYMDGHPDVAVAGPQLLWPDGRVQSSRRRFPTLAIACVDSTFLEKWFPRHPVLARYKMCDVPDDITVDVDWMVGACLMVRREAIDQVGLLDDGFFMYSEELDWQRRFANAGWRTVYLPDARVVHYHGQSAGQVTALTHIRFSRSKVRYFCKHHGPLAGMFVRMWLMINYAYEWTVELFKWLVGHKRELRRERMRAYAQVLRSGLRP